MAPVAVTSIGVGATSFSDGGGVRVWVGSMIGCGSEVIIESAQTQYVPSLQNPHGSLGGSDVIRGCIEDVNVDGAGSLLLWEEKIAVKSVSMTIPASDLCRFSSGDVGGGDPGLLRSEDVAATETPRVSSRHWHRLPSVHAPQPIAISVVAITASAHAHEPFVPHLPQVRLTGLTTSSRGETICAIENGCGKGFGCSIVIGEMMELFGGAGFNGRMLEAATAVGAGCDDCGCG